MTGNEYGSRTSLTSKISNMKKALSVIVILIICLLISGMLIPNKQASAVVIRQTTLEERVMDDDCIVIGKVFDVKAGEQRGDKCFERFYTFFVETVIKGNPEINNKYIDVWKLCFVDIPGYENSVDTCESGVRWLLFLKSYDNTTYLWDNGRLPSMPLELELPCPKPYVIINFVQFVQNIFEIMENHGIPTNIKPAKDLSLEEMTMKSDLIAEGIITRKLAPLKIERDRIGPTLFMLSYWVSNLSVDKVIKGSSDIKEAYIVAQVGPMNRLEDWIFDEPALSEA